MSDTPDHPSEAADPSGAPSVPPRSGDDTTPPPAARRPLLGWAPPGLERVQGDLWLVVRKQLVAGTVLVAPLVLALALPQSPHSLGPFGQAWWLTLLTTLIGLVLLLDATVALFRLLRRAVRSVKEGYAPGIVALVMTDRARDAGFLVQGARVYSELSDAERAWVERLRTWTPALYLAAGLWMTFGFGAITLLAARGATGPVGIAFVTLIPPALFVLTGVLLSALEGSLIRRAKRAWFKRPWSQDLAVADAAEWRSAAESSGVHAAVREGSGSLLALRVSLGAVLLAALVAVVPPATLVPVSSAGAILSSVAGYSFARSRARLAQVEVFRQYRVDPDPSISAEEAGEILNVLGYVGDPDRITDGLKPPARIYEQKWYPEEGLADAPTGIPLFWSDSVWVSAARGFTAAERTYLRSVASNPADAELSRLARAQSIDVVDGRYQLPFDDATASWNLPIMRFTGIRQGANAHLGIAALRLSEGRGADAERMVREVISLGFLMMEESPSLIDSFVGRVIVENGGRALVHVLRGTRRGVEADALEASDEAAKRAVSIVTPRASQEVTGQAYLATLPPIVADTTVMRSLRWEYLGAISALTPCLNLRRVVFGPGDDHEAWLQDVRSTLVRYPSEAAYFELTSRGFGTNRNAGFLWRVMAMSMGGMSREGSCAHLLSTLSSVM